MSELRILSALRSVKSNAHKSRCSVGESIRANDSPGTADNSVARYGDSVDSSGNDDHLFWG